MGGLACDEGGGVTVQYPEAKSFAEPPIFVGAWKGTLGDFRGELQIGELSPREYFGNFDVGDGRHDVALLMEQSIVQSSSGGALPSNRILFTWQNGMGERGRGYLLIDESSTRLRGASGEGGAIEGMKWDFTRVDANPDLGH